MSILKLFSLILCLTFSLTLVAEDSKEAKKPEAKEAEKPEVKKELPEWVEIASQISTLESKRQQKEENIAKLIEEKQKLPSNSPEVKTVIDEMVSDYNEMRKVQEERDKKITILKFRYPERGAKEDRKYDHKEIKSLDQMEQELGLDGRLNRNMKKLRSQYQADSKKSADSDKSGSTEDAVQKPAPKSIDDTGSIILKK